MTVGGYLKVEPCKSDDTRRAETSGLPSLAPSGLNEALRNLTVNTFLDGLFHIGTYILVLSGLFWLWNVSRATACLLGDKAPRRHSIDRARPVQLDRGHRGSPHFENTPCQRNRASGPMDLLGYWFPSLGRGNGHRWLVYRQEWKACNACRSSTTLSLMPNRLVSGRQSGRSLRCPASPPDRRIVRYGPDALLTDHSMRYTDILFAVFKLPQTPTSADREGRTGIPDPHA